METDKAKMETDVETGFKRRVRRKGRKSVVFVETEGLKKGASVSRVLGGWFSEFLSRKGVSWERGWREQRQEQIESWRLIYHSAGKGETKLSAR